MESIATQVTFHSFARHFSDLLLTNIIFKMIQLDFFELMVTVTPFDCRFFKANYMPASFEFLSFSLKILVRHSFFILMFHYYLYLIYLVTSSPNHSDFLIPFLQIAKTGRLYCRDICFSWAYEKRI